MSKLVKERRMHEMKKSILSFALPLLLALSPASASAARLLWVSVDGDATLDETTVSQYQGINAFQVSVTDGTTLTNNLVFAYEDAQGAMVVDDSTANTHPWSGDVVWVPVSLADYTDPDLDVTLELGYDDGSTFKTLAYATETLGYLLDAPHVSIQADLNPPAMTPWAPDEFTPFAWAITYDLDGGTNDEANPATYTSADLPITLLDASREGYTFAGWTNESGTVVTEIADGTTGDLAFGATWLENVEPPTGTDAVYDGTEKTGVPTGTGYTLAGDATATAAGSYTVTASLAAGYAWSDGTVADKTVTWSIAQITASVTIVGNYAETVFDGASHGVSGYTATADTPLYDVDNDIAFSGTATASRTVVGTTHMGLSAGQFASTNPNFSTVTFTVTDGFQTITPKAITVTVTGTASSSAYTGQEQTGTVAYALACNDPLFNAANVSFSGAATVSGTAVDSYAYGLAAGQFSYNDANIDATFDVTDAAFTITKASITVTVTGTASSATYTGSEQTGTVAYTLASDDALYDASKVAYSGAATVAGTTVGSYAYGLDEGDFTYDDADVEVAFTVTDANFSITPAAVTVTADNLSKVAGNADPTLTATVTGLFGSDTVSYTLARVAGEAVGTYAITPSGDAEQGNYAVTYVPGTFTISGAVAMRISADGTATNYYATLAGAVAEAQDGETVKLLSDVALDARVEPNVGAGTSLTIDLGGHTITRTGTSGNGSAFDVKSGNVVITNGVIDCTQDDAAIVADGVYAITVRGGANVTLADLDITVDSQAGACAYPFAGAMLTIESGTYANVTDQPYQYHAGWTGMAVNQANVTNQLITITGGTFSQVDPALGDDSASSGTMTFVDSGYVTVLENGAYVVHEAVTVTFDSNGGTPVEAVVIAKGATVAEPDPAPERNYDIFNAWQWNGADYDFAAPVTDDITLVADWTAMQHFEYDLNGGDSCSVMELTLVPGSTYQGAVQAVWADHVFRGWWTEPTGGTRYQNGKSVVPDLGGETLILYAHWVDAQIVHFNANGGTVDPESVICNVGEAYWNFPTPTWSNAKFLGWYTAPEGGDRVKNMDKPVTTNAERTLYAHWKGPWQTVHFDANGGECSTASVTCQVGKAYWNFPTPTRENYAFRGWWTATDGGDRVMNTDSPVTTNLDLYLHAHWEGPFQYVQFNANGGTCSKETGRYVMSETYWGFPTPTREDGSKFLGWYTAENGGDRVKNGMTVDGPTNLPLYAHWERTWQTVHFNPNGGTVDPESVRCQVGKSYWNFPTPTRENYAFRGWWTAPEGGERVMNTDNPVTGDADLYLFAHWEGPFQYVQFNAMGGSCSKETGRYVMGETYWGFPTPTRENFKFLGWYTSEDGGDRVKNGMVVDGDTNLPLYAHWQEKARSLAISAFSRSAQAGAAARGAKAATVEYTLWVETVADVVYEVQWTTALDGEWTVLKRWTADEDGATEVHVSVPAQMVSGFFRVVQPD